jgi:hypothetical protein
MKYLQMYKKKDAGEMVCITYETPEGIFAIQGSETETEPVPVSIMADTTGYHNNNTPLNLYAYIVQTGPRPKFIITRYSHIYDVSQVTFEMISALKQKQMGVEETKAEKEYLRKKYNSAKEYGTLWKRHNQIKRFLESVLPDIAQNKYISLEGCSICNPEPIKLQRQLLSEKAFREVLEDSVRISVKCPEMDAEDLRELAIEKELAEAKKIRDEFQALFEKGNLRSEQVIGEADINAAACIGIGAMEPEPEQMPVPGPEQIPEMDPEHQRKEYARLNKLGVLEDALLLIKRVNVGDEEAVTALITLQGLTGKIRFELYGGEVVGNGYLSSFVDGELAFSVRPFGETGDHTININSFAKKDVYIDIYIGGRPGRPRPQTPKLRALLDNREQVATWDLKQRLVRKIRGMRGVPAEQ